MTIFKNLMIVVSLCYIVADASNSKSKSRGISSSNVYDYIIVGAGISGLSQMEFIDFNLPTATKLLIEQHDRVGGRAFSLNATYGNKTITFEYGAAMRQRWNIWFYKMIEYLGLCPNMVMMDASTNTRRRERFFRNIYKNNSIAADGDYYPLVYNFRDDENTDTRFADIRDEFYAENNNGSAPQDVSQMLDCLENWTFRGNKLDKYNQYSLYKNVFNVSVEYIEWRKERQFPTFWDTSVDYCNYGSFFPWSTARPSDVDGGQFTLKGGYNAITQRLYEKLDDTENNEFVFGEQVISINYNKKKSKRRRENNRNKPKYLITTRNFDDYSIIEEYYADNVILAIPPMNLKQILPNIDPFCAVRGDKNRICYKIKDDIKDLIIDSKNEVEPGYKINLIYDNYWDWVEQLNITDFIQSITDLDIRSFYIDSNWQSDNLFAIQFYSRVHQARQLNWLQKSVEDDTYEFNPDVVISHFGNTDVKYTPSSKQLVSSVLKELADLLNIDYDSTLINNPLAAFSHSFGLNETGLDGIYVWNTNTVRSDVINNILQPLDDEAIYIISVDYSRAVADHSGGIYAAIQNTIQNLDMINPLENVTYCAPLP